jgi:hypothetical protein
MQFVLMFGVMLILPIPCLFVLLRIAVRLRVPWRPSWYMGISSLRQVVLLITPFYLIMFAINHCDTLRLIWWDLIGFPSIVYPSPCRHMNYWLDLLLLYLVLGSYYFIMIMFQLCSCLIIVHDKIILLIGTWSDHLGKQCYHKGGMGCPWLTN